MIEKLRSIAVFANVADQGSFRAAAASLGLAPSRISEIISKLEAELGVTLLYRTTRQLSLTHEGRLLYQKAQVMMEAAEEGLDAINPTASTPTGYLRISAPAFVAQTQLIENFAAFVRDHPGVDTTFHFSDHRSDLIKDGYDIAIRAGWLEDSEFMSRSIGQTERMLVASPAYAATKAQPQHPDDLEDWDWVRFEMRPDQTILTAQDGQTATVTGASQVTVNSAEALHAFATHGLGITAIPAHLAHRGIERGELIEILPDWRLRPLGLFAVWPSQSRRENLTTLFVRFLAGRENVRPSGGPTPPPRRSARR